MVTVFKCNDFDEYFPFTPSNSIFDAFPFLLCAPGCWCRPWAPCPLDPGWVQPMGSTDGGQGLPMYFSGSLPEYWLPPSTEVQRSSHQCFSVPMPFCTNAPSQFEPLPHTLLSFWPSDKSSLSGLTQIQHCPLLNFPNPGPHLSKSSL